MHAVKMLLRRNECEEITVAFSRVVIMTKRQPRLLEVEQLS